MRCWTSKMAASPWSNLGIIRSMVAVGFNFEICVAIDIYFGFQLWGPSSLQVPHNVNIYAESLNIMNRYFVLPKPNSSWIEGFWGEGSSTLYTLYSVHFIHSVQFVHSLHFIHFIHFMHFIHFIHHSHKGKGKARQTKKGKRQARQDHSGTVKR